MITLKSILCPTDLSEDSPRTVRYAVALARAYEAKVFMCNRPEGKTFALILDPRIGNQSLIVISIGFLSAIVEVFIAYCAGTAGSMLIIGTAAGVAVMGIDKIDFFWYLKKIGWLAALGYLAGASIYILQEYLIRLGG